MHKRYSFRNGAFIFQPTPFLVIIDTMTTQLLGSELLLTSVCVVDNAKRKWASRTVNRVRPVYEDLEWPPNAKWSRPFISPRWAFIERKCYRWLAWLSREFPLGNLPSLRATRGEARVGRLWDPLVVKIVYSLVWISDSSWKILEYLIVYTHRQSCEVINRAWSIERLNASFNEPYIKESTNTGKENGQTPISSQE